MTKHCLFGHFAQVDYRSPGLGQAFGLPGLVLWVWFLHQSCAIMCLVPCPIGLAPIEPLHFKLWLPKPAELILSPAGQPRQLT